MTSTQARPSQTWAENDYLLNAKVVVVALNDVPDSLPCNPSYLRNRRLGLRGIVHNCYGRHDGKMYWYVKNDDGFYSLYTQDELEPQDGYEEMRRVPGTFDPPQAAMYRWHAHDRAWKPVPRIERMVIRIGADPEDPHVVETVEYKHH